MRRAPTVALLGPASLLYLIAHAAAAQGLLDRDGWIAASVAFALSLAHMLLPREDEYVGGKQVGWMALLLSFALVRVAAPDALALTVDIAQAVSLSLVGAILLDLALGVPDRVAGPAHTRLVRLLVYATATTTAAAACAAHAPPVEVMDRLLIISPRWTDAPKWTICATVALALALRLLRKRLGSGPEALASNAWALMGLIPACALALCFAAARAFDLEAGSTEGRLSLVVCAALLVFSHHRLCDPRQRLRVGPIQRDAVAALGALGLLSATVVVLSERLPRAPLPLALTTVATLLCALAAFRTLRPAVTHLLAPFGGRLLHELEQLHHDLPGVSTLDQLGALVLRCLRRASGDASAQGRLYLLDPQLEVWIDLAGQPHIESRELPATLLDRLRDQPGEIVIRAQLEAQIVRQPAIRPLIDQLRALDALCVVPLTEAAELEGALVLPRGLRRAALSLEELEALRRCARHITGYVSVLAAHERASRRAADARNAVEHARSEIDDLRGQVRQMSAHLRMMQNASKRARLHDPVFAYSTKMRALLRHSEAIATQDGPVLIQAEGGVPVAPLAQQVHSRGKRARDVFVIGDCASLPVDEDQSVLLQPEPELEHGWVGLARGGTLLLLDLPALTKPAQQALLDFLSEKQRRPRGLPPARIIASVREPLSSLVARGAVLQALASRFAAMLEVPPLRERPEDLPSSILAAIDRACRLHGKKTVGIEADARQRLLAHDWPNNLQELQSTIEHAVVRCAGPRITASDLPLLRAASGRSERGHPLDDTLESLEQQVLRRALERARGNKSEAARLLGVPRTTFLDKLRRHGLEETSARAN